MSTIRPGAYEDTVQMAGIPTFFKTPYIPLDIKKLKKEKITVGILGVPYEGGSTYRPGASFGPMALRIATAQFCSYLYDYDIGLFDTYNIADCGDVPVNPINIKKAHRQIADCMTILLDASVLPVLIGGDHSITTGGVMSLGEKTKGPIGLFIIDAHLDVSENIGGEVDSYATFIARLINSLPNLDGKNVAVVGVRGAANPRSRWEFVKRTGLTVISMMEMLEIGVKAAIEKGLQVVLDGTKAFYLSYDIDGVDPAYAPGTGAPEPGGFTSREILQVANIIGCAQPAAFDICELFLNYDPSGITASLVGYLVLHTLAARTIED